MNENKIKTLLALAQLDAGQNQPDPREAMAGQMLMQMLGMNQQQETQAGQMDLDRERMAQAAQQFELGQSNALTMNREDIEMKKLQHQELLSRAEKQYGMDMLREMGANQRAYDEANQKKAFQEENRGLALKQLLAGIIQDAIDPAAREQAMRQFGLTDGVAVPTTGPVGVDMEAKRKQLEASKSVNSVLGLPEGYKSPLYSLFH